MKFSVVLGALGPVASAHYFFNSVTSKGADTTPNKYIRASTRAVAYNPIKFSSNPAADIRDGSTIDGPDARCNQGAFTNAGKTDILTVKAGEEVRVKLGVGAKMQHPGPGLVYMSRAPNDDVKSYDGSKDWFKIFDEGVCNQGADFTKDAWCTYDRDWIAASVPKDTPSGEYLMRFEHIGVHRSHVNQPEHYVSCVQVKVTDGGSGTPGPMVQFPGAYKATDPYANFSIYNGAKAFPMPGPTVWKGGNSGGSAASATSTDSSDSSAANPPAAEAASDSAASSDSDPACPAASPAPAASAPAAAAASEAPAQSGQCASMWQQCGGKTFTGSTCCSAGSCKAINEWYHQCA